MFVVKNSHKKVNNKITGRALPVAILLLVFCGVSALLFCSSFFNHAARADDSSNNSGIYASGSDTAESVEPSPEPDDLPAAAPVISDNKIYVPVHTNTVLWKNIPLTGGSEEITYYLNKSARLKNCFVSGSGNPLSGYSWGCDIPETEAVDGDYFADTVFIGNSIEEGFMIYSGLTTADFYAANL